MKPIDENDNRDDVSETAQADAAIRLLAACRNDRAEAARRLAWSRAKLDRRLALADLSDAVKRALDEHRIKVGHAELLAAVPGDKQDKALETILVAGMDVARTRDLLTRVTQKLAGALIDKTECTTCPFDSGTQRVGAVAETFHVLDADTTIFRKKWAKLMRRKRHHLIEDALVAATALVHKLTVVTRHVADFEMFGVDILNPFEHG